METKRSLLEWKGIALAIVTYIITFVLFFYSTNELFYCVFAALLTAAIVWGTYIVIRLCYLAAVE